MKLENKKFRIKTQKMNPKRVLVFLIALFFNIIALWSSVKCMNLRSDHSKGMQTRFLLKKGMLS
jgi:hypothetical protein